MKYRTTIEIVTEAGDKSEAAEIAGDYLSGNIISGIDMKCRTKPVQNAAAYVAVVALIGMLVGMSVYYTAGNMKYSGGPGAMVSEVNAIQPPLKTSAVESKSAEFRRMWQDKQTDEALKIIKR